jgi:hypothetical protein
MLKTEFQVTGIKDAARILNKVEPDLIKSLRKDLQTSLKPIAVSIANSVPDVPSQLRGVAANKTGRAKWSRPTGKVQFIPAKLFQGKSIHPLVSLYFSGKNNAFAFNYLEIAGTQKIKPRANSKKFIHWRSGESVSYIYNGQGKGMLKGLEKYYPIKGRSGRFVFDEYLRRRKDITAVARNSIENFVDSVNVKLGN